MSLTLQDYIIGVQNKTIDPKQYLAETLSKIENNTLNAFIRLHPDYASSHIDVAGSLSLA